MSVIGYDTEFVIFYLVTVHKHYFDIQIEKSNNCFFKITTIYFTQIIIKKKLIFLTHKHVDN